MPSDRLKTYARRANITPNTDMKPGTGAYVPKPSYHERHQLTDEKMEGVAVLLWMLAGAAVAVLVAVVVLGT